MMRANFDAAPAGALPMTVPTRLSFPRLAALAASFMALGLGGCAVIDVAGSAAGAAISVTGAVVSTGVRVTGAVVEAGVKAATKD
jgi:hypothetical protein